MVDTFSTEFYRSIGARTCPNGDKVRSDEQGLFCVVEGRRVAVQELTAPVTALLAVDVVQPIFEPVTEGIVDGTTQGGKASRSRKRGGSGGETSEGGRENHSVGVANPADGGGSPDS